MPSARARVNRGLARLARAAVDAALVPARRREGLGRSLAWLGADLREEARLQPGQPPPGQPPLHAIPSETSDRERELLFSYFALLWPGAGHVVEIGPFLGGTTRAIAIGMLANPRRDPGAKLFTYDRFEDYYDRDDLARRLAGYPDESVHAALTEGRAERGNFRDVFEALHAATPYRELLAVRAEPLPDTPEQATAPGSFRLDFEADAFFVDGCKSWVATRHLLIQAAAAARPGAHLIFQDYGWRTCFWIPAALHALRDHLVPFAEVDWTRAFGLARALGPSEVEARLPATPEQGGRAFFDAAFDALLAEARGRGARRAALRYGLQHAAALAYLGHLDEARERLRGLLRDNRFSEDRAMIEDSLRSPTYRPDGTPVTL